MRRLRTHRLCSRSSTGFYLVLAAEIFSFRVTQILLISNTWNSHKKQLSHSPVRTRTDCLLMKVQPRWNLKAQDWRGLAKKLKIGTMRKTNERLLEKCNQVAAEDPGIWRSQYYGWLQWTEATVESSLPKLRIQTVCATVRELEKRPKPIRGAQKMVNGSQTKDIVIYTVGS